LERSRPLGQLFSSIASSLPQVPLLRPSLPDVSLQPPLCGALYVSRCSSHLSGVLCLIGTRGIAYTQRLSKAGYTPERAGFLTSHWFSTGRRTPSSQWTLCVLFILSLTLSQPRNRHCHQFYVPKVNVAFLPFSPLPLRSATRLSHLPARSQKEGSSTPPGTGDVFLSSHLIYVPRGPCPPLGILYPQAKT
jgi:hypothetical protein